MSNTETLFNPVDNSLEARVRAYYSVCQAFSLSQASLRHPHKVGETDYIGDEASIQEAHDLAKSSLIQANQQVSKEDLHTAQDSGLLTSEQFAEIFQTQRAQQMGESRQSETQQSTQLKR